jgi:hypothetical protein
MFKSVCLIGAVLMIASPALAEQSCGSSPIAPAISGAAELSGKSIDDAHTVVLAALKNVKAYQGTLSSFRECLTTQANAQKAVVAEAKSKGDKAKIDAAQQQMQIMQAAYDKTVDTETQVVTDYSGLHDAYCKLGDGLKGCPKAH